MKNAYCRYSTENTDTQDGSNILRDPQKFVMTPAEARVARIRFSARAPQDATCQSVQGTLTGMQRLSNENDRERMKQKDFCLDM